MGTVSDGVVREGGAELSSEEMMENLALKEPPAQSMGCSRPREQPRWIALHGKSLGLGETQREA